MLDVVKPKVINKLFFQKYYLVQHDDGTTEIVSQTQIDKMNGKVSIIKEL